MPDPDPVVCSCQNIVLLTGTPLQNNLHELYALLNFMHPDIFTTSDPFDQAFDLTKNRCIFFYPAALLWHPNCASPIYADPILVASVLVVFGGFIMLACACRVDNDALEAAHRLIQPICLRRLKEDVEKSLPARVSCSSREPAKTFYRALCHEGSWPACPLSPCAMVLLRVRGHHPVAFLVNFRHQNARCGCVKNGRHENVRCGCVRRWRRAFIVRCRPCRPSGTAACCSRTAPCSRAWRPRSQRKTLSR